MEEVILMKPSAVAEIFRKVFREEMAAQQAVAPPVQSTKLYSIKELAAYLHVSLPTATRYKNEGIIPYIQCARKCTFDTNEVMAALKKYSDK
jgi:hypothetical protein